MFFSDDDLHKATKIALETLIDIINKSDDLNQRGNAAINLANVVMAIWDRQHGPDEEMIELEGWEEDEDGDED